MMAKAMASPGVIGIFAGAIGFIFLWPKTAKEGFSRIAASGICSHFFGDALLRTIVHFAEWIPPDEIRAGAYLVAGLPAWWLMGAIIRYFKSTEDKDIKQIAEDVRKSLKEGQP